MSKRGTILAGMAAGALWAVCLVWIGRTLAPQASPALALFVIGLTLLAPIGRLAQRRFFDDTLIDGAAYAPGSSEEIDDRVLRNTAEQVLLAVCIWPFAGAQLGGGVLTTLAVGFVVARAAFWIGYHRAPPLRAFGFAATFYPTILVALLSALAGVGVLPL